MKRYRNETFPSIPQFVENYLGLELTSVEQLNTLDSRTDTGRDFGGDNSPSRITALIGTRHSKHHEVVKLLHIFRHVNETAWIDNAIDDALPNSASSSPSDYDTIVQRVTQILTQPSHRPPPQLSNQELRARIAERIRFRSFSSQSRQRHGSQPTAELDHDTDRDIEKTVFNDVLRDVLRYGRLLLSSRVNEPFSDKPLHQHAIDDIAEIVEIKRDALNDRKAFWESSVMSLSDDMGLYEQFSNFFWRNSNVLFEFFINLLARLRIYSIEDLTHAGDKRIVQLFLRNLARKFNRRTRTKDQYVLIWVDRALGSNLDGPVESPIFNALVTSLDRGDYCRHDQHQFRFHLVISGLGDMRYVLQSLGISPSGGHFRIQYLDPGPVPGAIVENIINNSVQTTSRNLLDKLLNDADDCPAPHDHWFDSSRQETFRQHTRKRYYGNVEAGMIPLPDDERDFEASKAHVHNDVLQHLQHIYSTSLNPNADSPVNDSDSDSGVDDHLDNFRAICTSIRSYITDIQAHCVNFHGCSNGVTSDDADRGMYLSQIDIVRETIDRCMKWTFRHYYLLAYEALFRHRLGDHIESPDQSIVHDRDWFKRLVDAQLRPFFNTDANNVLSALERARCTDVACQVAYAFYCLRDYEYQIANFITHELLKYGPHGETKHVDFGVSATRLDEIEDAFTTAIYRQTTCIPKSRFLSPTIRSRVRVTLFRTLKQGHCLRHISSDLEKVQGIASDKPGAIVDSACARILSHAVPRASASMSVFELRWTISNALSHGNRTDNCCPEQDKGLRPSNMSVDEAIGRMLAAEMLEVVFAPSKGVQDAPVVRSGENEIESNSDLPYVYLGQHVRIRSALLQERLLELNGRRHCSFDSSG